MNEKKLKMAIMIKGLLGGFTGRLGNVVGYYYRGVNVIRTIPRKRKGPGKPAQIEQRVKFGMAVKFLKPLAPFMNRIHGKCFKNMSGYNKLCSLNMKQIITGAWPDFRIDYRQVKLTVGHLPRAVNATIALEKKSRIAVQWEAGLYHDHALPTDQLYLAFFEEESKKWKVLENIATRKDDRIVMDMVEYRCCRLQFYTGFISENGIRVSNSQYLGMINIV